MPLQLDALNGTTNTTAAIQASPLSFLVALPAPVNSGGATAPAAFSAVVYNDDGSTVHVSCRPESPDRSVHLPLLHAPHLTTLLPLAPLPQVGANPCNFLLANATLNSTNGRASGTLLLSVGGPQAAALVQPAVSAADASTSGPPDPAWPLLGSINVLGWHANVSSATLAEVAPGGNATGTGRSWDIVPERCAYLRLLLRSLGLPLRCGASYQLSWSE